MRYYTKEWYKLMQSIGNAEMFEPIIDKEYSEDEIKELYKDMLDKHIQEERDLYDEPPVFNVDEWKEEFPEDEFDPEDYLIGEIGDDGEAEELRHPETYKELLEFQMAEYEFEWKEYENRPPFDEKEAAEEFREDYEDSLEEPDEDIPLWVRESVDPRMIAMGVLPESVYKKLLAEESKNEARFDELDEIADMEYVSMYEDLMEGDYSGLDELPAGVDGDDVVRLIEDFDDLESDYVLSVEKDGGDIVVSFLGWDEEGDEIVRRATFEDAEVIEDDGVSITTEKDEDGDTVSNCDFSAYELYCMGDGFEFHMLFDNEELKYYTLKCSYITITEERA